MERLTIQGENLESLDSTKLPKYGELYWKLNKYEDLEEQGKLLKLPCAVGDTVYAFHMAKVIEFKVIKISWFTMDRENIINVECLNTDCDCFRNFIKEEFGKTVFPTKEEAEAALKELYTSGRA